MAVTKVCRPLILLGQCVPSITKNASKIRVKHMDFDSNIHMYFRKDEYVFAHDPEKVCKPGDIVLVEKLKEKLTVLISHKVLKVVYPFGDITDPLTGKKCVVGKYRDDIEDDIELFGDSESRFKYEDAPDRGWQKDKKDFTYQETYKKYHVFPDDDQPYAV